MTDRRPTHIRYGYDRDAVEPPPILSALRGLLDDVDLDRLGGPEYAAGMWARAEPQLVEARERHADAMAGGYGAEVVYFIRLGNRIKIGTSRNLAARLRTLQPEELLGLLAGGRDVEYRLHVQFAGHRVVGEWFEDCPPIRAFIAENCR